MENQYLVFSIDNEYYGITISVVSKVIRAVELIQLPSEKGTLLGLINLMGQIIPVINIRKRFQIRERGIEVSDRIIISQNSLHHVAFIVDSVEGIVDLSLDQIHNLNAGSPIKAVGKNENSVIKICDVVKCLTLEDLAGGFHENSNFDKGSINTGIGIS